MAYCRDDGSTGCRRGSQRCYPQLCPSADHVCLFPVDVLRLNNIYGTRVKAIWALAARELCRPGAQGSVAEFRSAGHHAAGILCICACRRRVGLPIRHASHRHCTQLLSLVAGRNAKRPESPR